MKVYIIRKLHWEYQDYNNIYEIVDEEPVRAYRSKADAELTCQILNTEERQNWKPPCQTVDLEPMAEQDFFEVVEMGLEE